MNPFEYADAIIKLLDPTCDLKVDQKKEMDHDKEKKNPFTYIRRKSHGELIRELLEKEAKNGTDSER